MKNLKILSMNLGNSYIPIIDKKKKTKIAEFIQSKEFDIVMLQGNNRKLEKNYLGYEIVTFNNRVVTLVNSKSSLGVVGEVKFGKIGNVTISPFNANFDKTFLACININSNKKNNIKDIFNICKLYCDEKMSSYSRYRIIAGSFPRNLNIEDFCNQFDLEDISSSIGQSYYSDKELLDYIFISKNLKVVNNDVYKHIGLVDVDKALSTYPIEASVTLKKVLK